ncbi:MAG: hypothetical protein LBN95_05840 [Prevotellaceae bacterium]|jgi:hypothetical protein|nr:hypothetical protein [Prevotellaceae bacterium]
MEYIEKMKILTHNLEKCERVTKHSTIDEKQSNILANSLMDIEESLQTININIPKLYSKNINAEEIDDIILDIGEEFRHILYHIKDTKVFEYLFYGNDAKNSW